MSLSWCRQCPFEQPTLRHINWVNHTRKNNISLSTLPSSNACWSAALRCLPVPCVSGCDESEKHPSTYPCVGHAVWRVKLWHVEPGVGQNNIDYYIYRFGCIDTRWNPVLAHFCDVMCVHKHSLQRTLQQQNHGQRVLWFAVWMNHKPSWED